LMFFLTLKIPSAIWITCFMLCILHVQCLQVDVNLDMKKDTQQFFHHLVSQTITNTSKLLHNETELAVKTADAYVA